MPRWYELYPYVGGGRVQAAVYSTARHCKVGIVRRDHGLGWEAVPVGQDPLGPFDTQDEAARACLRAAKATRP
jgi:hypothetical protein